MPVIHWQCIKLQYYIPYINADYWLADGASVIGNDFCLFSTTKEYFKSLNNKDGIIEKQTSIAQLNVQDLCHTKENGYSKSQKK